MKESTYTWQVKFTNRYLFKMLYVGLIVIYAVYFCVSALSETDNSQREESAVVLLVFSPILLSLGLIPLIWINKKKIPQKIELNLAESKLELTLRRTSNSHSNKLEYSLSALAFEQRVYSSFSVLILYRKKLATRGHFNYFKDISIVCPAVGLSWQQEDLADIVSRLRESGVTEHHTSNEWTFYQYIMGDDE